MFQSRWFRNNNSRHLRPSIPSSHRPPRPNVTRTSLHEVQIWNLNPVRHLHRLVLTGHIFLEITTNILSPASLTPPLKSILIPSKHYLKLRRAVHTGSLHYDSFSVNSYIDHRRRGNTENIVVRAASKAHSKYKCAESWFHSTDHKLWNPQLVTVDHALIGTSFNHSTRFGQKNGPRVTFFKREHIPGRCRTKWWAEIHSLSSVVGRSYCHSTYGLDEHRSNLIHSQSSRCNTKNLHLSFIHWFVFWTFVRHLSPPPSCNLQDLIIARHESWSSNLKSSLDIMFSRRCRLLIVFGWSTDVRTSHTWKYSLVDRELN